MTNFLENTDLTSKQAEIVSLLKESTCNLMSIVNNLLDFSRIRSGQIKLEPSPFDPRAMVDSINDTLLGKFYEKHQKFEHTVTKNVPKTLNGDVDRIKQVIINLLTNATKFTKRNGKISLSVSGIMEGNTFHLVVSVKDNGRGIEKEHIPKLFTDFCQFSEPSIKIPEQGTGLGLAIARRLVELMGGRIWLERTRVGRGSEFKVEIPLEVPEDEIIVEDVDAFRGLNVLIVDDNVQNRLDMARLCEKWKMRYTVFSTPTEALFHTERNHYDVCFVDICMPRFNGVKFAREFVRQNSSNKLTPLIALSSLDDRTVDSEGLFKAHLIKPISESRLRSELMRVIKGGEVHSKRPPSIDDNGVRFVVVEDDAINRFAIRTYLEGWGIRHVEVLNSPSECLSYLEMGRWNGVVFLIDIKMPEMSGFELMSVLRKKTSGCRYVAVTAFHEADEVSGSFDYYVPKPIDQKTLFETVKRCIEDLSASDEESG